VHSTYVLIKINSLDRQNLELMAQTFVLAISHTNKYHSVQIPTKFNNATKHNPPTIKTKLNNPSG